MELIQLIKPEIIMNCKINRVFCCEESQNLHYLKPGLYREYPVTYDDLKYRYCPYCGEQILLINQYPTKAEIEILVSELINKCESSL
jgi:hypothetical protein